MHLFWVLQRFNLLSNGTFQVNAAAEVIYDLVDPSANLIFGAVIDPSISGQVSFFFHTSFNLLFLKNQVIWSNYEDVKAKNQYYCFFTG